jgi:osmotically-inducible protein OsmY
MAATQQIVPGDRQTQSRVGEADYCLGRSLESILKNDPHLMNCNIVCECREGVVVMRGSVDSFYQKQMAQELVRNARGVTMVVNRMLVQPLHRRQ